MLGVHIIVFGALYQAHEMGTIIISISQMRKLRPREDRSFAKKPE